jgi:hypothetical protein
LYTVHRLFFIFNYFLLLCKSVHAVTPFPVIPNYYTLFGRKRQCIYSNCKTLVALRKQNCKIELRQQQNDLLNGGGEYGCCYNLTYLFLYSIMNASNSGGIIV